MDTEVQGLIGCFRRGAQTGRERFAIASAGISPLRFAAILASIAGLPVRSTRSCAWHGTTWMLITSC
jgi:hypothetical protein